MIGHEVIAALVGALNSMDADAFATLLADDVVVEHVSTGRVLRGKEEVAGRFRSMLEHTAKNDVAVKRVCVDGSTIWAERVDRHLIGDQWVEIPIMGIIELDGDGKMKLYATISILSSHSSHPTSLLSPCRRSSKQQGDEPDAAGLRRLASLYAGALRDSAKSTAVCLDRSRLHRLTAPDGRAGRRGLRQSRRLLFLMGTDELTSNT